MSDIVDDLRELREQMATVLDDEVILAVFTRAADEIQRLRAIADNLPQTADGVPVTPGMTCWYVSCGGRVNSFEVADLSDIATDWDDFGTRYYSTQQAARAAGGGDECVD